MEHRSGNRKSRRPSSPDPKAYDDLWVKEPGSFRAWLGVALRASSTKVCIIGPLVAFCYVAKLLITNQGLTSLQFDVGVMSDVMIAGFGLISLWMVGKQEKRDAKASEKIQDSPDESGDERHCEEDP